MMLLPRFLFVLFIAWCKVDAITVPIDRSDVQLSPTRSSMIANGWRPLTTGNLGTNVSPSSNLDRNVPHHPVIGKLHEHMQHQSSGPEKLKPQVKAQQQQKQKVQEYVPPSILGSFSVFGHAATKARPKPMNKEYTKQSTSAATHYSFLIPPPRDSFRFEIDPPRKNLLRENEAFIRQSSSFLSQGHQQETNVSPFFSKGQGFTSSTTNSPGFSKNRPFVINGFGGQQQALHNVRHNQQQQFEVQKASNTKSYFQPPGLDNPHSFVKDNQNSDTVNFGRFQNQPHSSQIPNGGAGNFYSQVDHPPPFKSNFERDPSFLVHESHEISYVTPPSNFGYNFRPSLPYDNLVPPNLFSSTNPPKVEQSNKYSSQDTLIKAQPLTAHGLPAGTYFLQSEQRPVTNSWTQQKSKFTTEINEVLPRKNPPSKFRQETPRPNQIFGSQPEVIFIRPSNNLQQQFESPISLGQAHQTTSIEPEYETPESISLKHFNEQQFLIQQQLVQQDRQRLQEQEIQRQREQQREQEEEVRKRQEEIRIFEQQEKEAEQKKLEEQKAEEEEAMKKQEEDKAQQELLEQFELRKQQQQQEIQEKLKQEQLVQQLEEQKKMHEQQFKIQQQEYNRPSVKNQDRIKPLQQTFETVVTGTEIKRIPEQYHQEEVQTEDGDHEVRPYRPKFPQRGSTRRRRPLNPGYVAQATEASVQDFNTYQSLTDAPPQTTTVEPEATTLPVPVTLRPRTRRPGQTLKKRRPYGTTSAAPLIESSSVTSSSIREPETSSRYQSLETDFSKRRRTRPTQATVVTEETVTERHYIRKRPSGHRLRVNPGEPFEAEVITEIVRPTRIIYKDTTEWENYPESFKKKDSQEIDTSSLPSQTLAFTQDMEQVPTENGQVFEFSTETFAPEEEVTTFEERTRNNRPIQSHDNDDDESNIPLEQLFDKPEENHVEPVTTTEDVPDAPDPTTTTTSTTTSTTTTTEIPTTTEVTSTTRQSLRIRPLKYGNSTRPRFSIKDYKSRLDYKNRLSQISTTEANLAVSSSPRRRFTTEKPEESSSSGTTSRYKYMSRPSLRSTTSSPELTSPENGDEEAVTERINRFKPKRKFNMSIYRSRVTSTGTTPYQSNKNVVNEDNRQSTTRPENIYSSAIRRPRPSYRNRNQPEVQSAATTTQEATEMTAEETSFYSSMTTPKVEEISENDDDDEEDKIKENGNEVGSKHNVEMIDEDSKVVTEASIVPTRRMEEVEDENNNDGDSAGSQQNESIPTIPAWTEPSRDAEDALISQRIANLTSSASELYEPGMFKAVSPATESRVINPHFAIATDEPTLPIEAFFQVLSKKDE